MMFSPSASMYVLSLKTPFIHKSVPPQDDAGQHAAAEATGKGEQEQQWVQLRTAEHQRIRTVSDAIHTAGNFAGEPGIQGGGGQQRGTDKQQRRLQPGER